MRGPFIYLFIIIIYIYIIYYLLKKKVAFSEETVRKMGHNSSYFYGRRAGFGALSPIHIQFHTTQPLLYLSFEIPLSPLVIFSYYDQFLSSSQIVRIRRSRSWAADRLWTDPIDDVAHISDGGFGEWRDMDPLFEFE